RRAESSLGFSAWANRRWNSPGSSVEYCRLLVAALQPGYGPVGSGPWKLPDTVHSDDRAERLPLDRSWRTPHIDPNVERWRRRRAVLGLQHDVQAVLIVGGGPRNYDSDGQAEHDRLCEISHGQLIPAPTHHIELPIDCLGAIGNHQEVHLGLRQLACHLDLPFADPALSRLY